MFLKHNKYKTPEYQAWSDMKQRCYNPNCKHFKDYGQRGIIVCQEWKNSFIAFYNYLGDKPTNRHTVERIDNNGNYCPDNVKWATQKEQGNNRRDNRSFTFDGKTLTIKQWAEIIGISKQALTERIERGWPIEEALSEPNSYRGKHCHRIISSQSHMPLSSEPPSP